MQIFAYCRFRRVSRSDRPRPIPGSTVKEFRGRRCQRLRKYSVHFGPVPSGSSLTAVSSLSFGRRRRRSSGRSVATVRGPRLQRRRRLAIGPDLHRGRRVLCTPSRARTVATVCDQRTSATVSLRHTFAEAYLQLTELQVFTQRIVGVLGCAGASAHQRLDRCPSRALVGLHSRSRARV